MKNVQERTAAAGAVRRVRAGGFTLVEILFAVMILGIGFIMIAGMFPVAIRQGQTTQEITAACSMAPSAAAVCRVAARFQPTNWLSTVDSANPDTKAFVIPVVTGNNYPAGLPAPGANLSSLDLQGNAISAADPRFAWVPLYSYNDKKDSYIQLILFGITARATDTFNSQSASVVAPQTISGVSISNGVLSAGGGGGGGSLPPNWAAINEGSYIVIGADQSGSHTNYCNGWILRVGAPDPTSLDSNSGLYSRWYMMPDGDLPNNPYEAGPDGVLGTKDDVRDITPCIIHVVGRGILNDSSGGGGSSFEGRTQDIAVFTTFITKP